MPRPKQLGRTWVSYGPVNTKASDPREPHHHRYEGEVFLYRVIKVHQNYNGTTGDKAFLYRKCSCGKGEVFEYGSRNDMKLLMEELNQPIYALGAE